MQQLVSAVSYMHYLGICHRDIKLQNILLETVDYENPHIKLIDFGFAFRFENALPMTTRCGTTYCTAPEVFRESYDERCDVWSIGVVTYVLLSGSRPFSAVAIPNISPGRNQKAAVVSNILMGRYHFNHEVFRSVSDAGKSFIEKLLEPVYENRCSAKMALNLPWLSKAECRSPNVKTLTTKHTELSLAISTLCGKRNSSKMGNTGLVAIAFNNSDKEPPELKTLFQGLDVDNQGYLSKKNFRKALKSIAPSLSGSEIDAVFNAIDIDGDEQISFTEFLAATIDPREVNTEEVSKAFELLDSDHKGYLTVNDFYRVLAVTPEKYESLMLDRARTDSEEMSLLLSKERESKKNSETHKELLLKILDMVSAADVNRDGVISYSEFLLSVMGIKEEKSPRNSIDIIANGVEAISRQTDLFCKDLSTQNCVSLRSSASLLSILPEKDRKTRGKLRKISSSGDFGRKKLSIVFCDNDVPEALRNSLSGSRSCPKELMCVLLLEFIIAVTI